MLRKSILALALMASPAWATNLVIDITGAANGQVVIELAADTAPQHVAQIVALANAGEYDNVMFHRVIDGFMAQTGDVRFGKVGAENAMAGMGGSSLPNIPAEFTDATFDRGVVGMARAQDPNSANSQFFIMFAPGPFLDGQYTIIGRVTSGMEVVDAIARGEPPAVPDVMSKVTVTD
jgi:peptidylprolyl isomerase